MLEAVIAVVQGLAGGFGALRSLGQERRQRLATLCDAIADVLEQYSGSASDRRRSINLCAELRNYVPRIREVAAGAPDPARVEALARELDRVCEAWSRRSASEGTGSADHEEELDQIAAASGEFRGFAGVLRTV